MSPVSKGRKRKPKRSERRRTARPVRRPEVRAEHGVDWDPYLGDLPPDTPEGEETLDRRKFAVPHRSATIDGEEFRWLDPADPDERALLIQGEHPEFDEYLADPSWSGEIDGMNPRFHLTMHGIIANQLWDNEPPEAWQAVRRLREQGTERHDILHELAGIMAAHLHPTLSRGEPFDDDAYCRALTDLGARDMG